MVVVLTFVLFNALSIVVNIADQIVATKDEPCEPCDIPLYFATLFVCVNSATNFIIYCAMGADFRRRFMAVLCLKSGSSRDSSLSKSTYLGGGSTNGHNTIVCMNNNNGNMPGHQSRLASTSSGVEGNNGGLTKSQQFHNGGMSMREGRTATKADVPRRKNTTNLPVSMRGRGGQPATLEQRNNRAVIRSVSMGSRPQMGRGIPKENPTTLEQQKEELEEELLVLQRKNSINQLILEQYAI